MAYVSAYSSQDWLVNITYGIGELRPSNGVSKGASVPASTGDTVNISDEARELLAAREAEAQGISEGDGKVPADAVQESGTDESASGKNVSAQAIKVGGAGQKSSSAESSDSSDEIDELEEEIKELKAEIEELQAKASSDEEAKEELKTKRIELVGLEMELALLQQQAQE